MTGKAITAMVTYFDRDYKRINHALKVLGYTKCIAEEEGFAGEDLLVVELAAVFHDIGIPEAIQQCGSSAGPHQERLGVEVAEPLLKGLRCPDHIVRSILFIIGHHHSYGVTDNPHLQIIFEADLLVNLEEGNIKAESVESMKQKIFRTSSGKQLAHKLFAS